MPTIEQWDIVRYRVQSTDKDWHPVIIFSPPEWCQNSEKVKLNVLMCSKKVPADGVKPYQVLLNEADGLDFLSACGCQFVHVAARALIFEKIGRVCLERRRAIMRKMVEVYRMHL